MEYRIAICDDESYYAEYSESYIKKFCSICEKKVLIKVYTDSDELLNTIKKRIYYDLYILDIEMPKCSGMDLLEELKYRGVETDVILLTAHPDYAIEAHEYSQVFRYILKNQFTQKMEPALTDFFIKMDQRMSCQPYIIENKTKFIRIFQEEIVYIFKDRKYAVFVMANGQKERERRGLQDIHKKLNNQNMVMLKRSVIINVRYVRRIQADEVTLDVGESIPTNREHIKKLRRIVDQYTGYEWPY